MSALGSYQQIKLYALQRCQINQESIVIYTRLKLAVGEKPKREFIAVPVGSDRPTNSKLLGSYTWTVEGVEWIPHVSNEFE